MLSTRILTALVLVPLVLAALFMLPPLGWALVTLALMVAASSEWANLARFARPLRILFVVGTAIFGLNLLFLPAAHFARGWPDGIVLAVCVPAVLFWVLVVPFWLRGRWAFDSPLAVAVVGWLVLIAAWVAVVQLQARSPGLALALMAIVWIADSAAYFAGRAFGKHKLAPWISPGKTWEGVYGAGAAVAVYALILVPFASGGGYTGERSALAVVIWALIAIVLAGVSVMGDLFESLLKRHAGVKDSGALFPGHGGALDRIDALIAAMPLASVAALLFVR
jgi:phosphatidate cytidylyltransferase